MSILLQTLLKSYIEELSKIYGMHLKKVILYGSYARGDFNKKSDVDLMILTDLNEKEIEEYKTLRESQQ